MSGARGAVERGAAGLGRRLAPARLLALCGVAVALGAFLSVLHRILVVTGEPAALYAVAGGAVTLGALAAALVRPRTAATIAVAVVVAGTYLYVRSLPGGVDGLAWFRPMLGDAVSLLSGMSVLRILNADIWALAAAPGPVFLGGYLGFRRRYVAAVAVGGGALGLLVLTGDATIGQTLAGVLGVTVAAAIGDCERRAERLRDADGVAVVLAAMVSVTLVAGVAPGLAGAVLPVGEFGDEERTIEASLVDADDSVSIAGPIELSPASRYTVEADERAYWRVGTYDRYTGDGWVRTGSTRRYEGALSGPPGESRTVTQRYTPETAVSALPAAAEPTRVDGVPVPVRVTEGGSLEPAGTLQPGESYVVESERLVATTEELRAADTAYPDGIEERYTQLPGDTPDRVAERTARLTANAENPYDTARVLERWFRTEYGYSLDAERPSGGIADAFLFEMEAGYCTYFATTMTTMLRTQGIPARFAVGYTPGERVDDDEWTVRGYNAHAWVEVYVPEHGWVEFDPTPPGPRLAAEREALAAAGNGTEAGIDGEESTETPATGEPTETPGTPEGTDSGATPTPTATETPTPNAGGGDGDEGRSVPSVPLPSGDQFWYALVTVAAAAAVSYRSGIGTRLYRELWLRRLPTDDPDAVAVGAYRRAVYLEARAGRTKAPGETPRQFLAGDARLERIAEGYERARYGGGVDAATAAELRAALAEVLEERSRAPPPL
jgi:transglutaminase-like putative cysteine protease